MANYITCKDTRAFAYADTNNKGYYELVAVSEDGNISTVKCVYHENKEIINKTYEILTERITDDFEAVDEIKVYEAIERAILSETGWRKKHDSFTTLPYYDRVEYNRSSFSDYNTNLWESTSYRETRIMTYVPNNESVCFPNHYNYMYNRETNDKSLIKNRCDDIFNKRTPYDLCEAFFVVNDSYFDEVVSYINESGYTQAEYPDELKLHLRSKEHKVAVFHDDTHFVYITNIRCEQIVFNSMIFTAEKTGRVLSDAAKQALIERDQETYYNEIFANIEEAVNGINERARNKMFEDFSNNFSGLMLAPLRNSVENAQRSYEDMLHRLNDKLNTLKEAREKLFYAEHGVNNAEDEFVSFINDIKDNIVSLKIEDSYINFCVRTFLTYWDDDLWEIFRKSDSRFNRLNQWQKNMLDEIFRDRTVKLLIEQKFCFDLRNSTPKRIDRYNDDIGEGTKGIKNPHIAGYNCWGTHKPIIERNLSESNLMQAYSQAISCIAGLTLDDSTVTGDFCNNIRNGNYDDKPCLFIVETGEYVTFKQYSEMVKGKKWEV